MKDYARNNYRSSPRSERWAILFVAALLIVSGCFDKQDADLREQQQEIQK